MSREIRIALAGIGNCSASLVQGVEHYKRNGGKTLGLVHPKVGAYSLRELSFVAAFDIDRRKVGKDLSEAVFSEPNNVRRITDLPKLGVRVQMAQPLDGISPIAGEKILRSDLKPCNVARVLEESEADLLVNLTPTGAAKASEMFAEAAWQSHCGYINATPSKIASSPRWQGKYRKRGLALLGDDVMDQVGSTILHKKILSMLVERGVHLDETYQLDIGGGTESQMALDKKRYEIKRSIKTAAVASAVPYRFPLVAGSSDFVDFMDNRRTSYFWIRGEYFAGTEFNMDIRLSLEDGPACAGILSDVIRMTKEALDRKAEGYFPAISAYGFKSPPRDISQPEMEEELNSLVLSAKRK